MKHLFQHGVIATGTILQTRKDMRENFKKGSEWGKGKGYYAVAEGSTLLGLAVG